MTHPTGYFGGGVSPGSLVALSVACLVACGGRFELGRAEEARGGGGAGGAAETTGGAPESGGNAAETAAGSTGDPVVEGAAGQDATGGSNGAAGAAAVGYSIARLDPEAPTQLDILVMIDNSPSMLEKQSILANSLPTLVKRFTQPRCLDRAGKPLPGSATPDGFCNEGTPEFEPIRDLHLGIVTSSLGGHGTLGLCDDPSRAQDDKAQLLGSVRPGLPDWAGSGFLAWDPGSNHTPPGFGDSNLFRDVVRAQVATTTDLGCNLVSGLEAWYRFLVDPDPVDRVENDATGNQRLGRNEVVLAQRAAFLRPRSLVAIVMVTDQNDCSINDEGARGWLVGYQGDGTTEWHMPPATASCSDPNSPCCRPCGTSAPSGCPDSSAEGCDAGPLSATDDAAALRCFDQKRRFGVDLLYPISRYVSALKDDFIDPRMDGLPVPNPLFSVDGSFTGRSPEMIYLAGIVGVPWQDTATRESLTDPTGLTVARDADERATLGTWSLVLGDPSENVPPRDPLMVEAIDPRPAGTRHPLVADAAIASADESGRPNPINGHEQRPSTARDDLQFACIFPLDVPRPCSEDSERCECTPERFEQNSPLCNYSGDGQLGTQEYAQAYPSLRALEVLRGVDATAVVGSICPKNVVANDDDASNDPDYGYNPTLHALADQIGENYRPPCLEQTLEYEESSDGYRVDCRVFELHWNNDSCSCEHGNGQWLFPPVGSDDLLDESLREALWRSCIMAFSDACGAGICVCEIPQLRGSDLADCQLGTPREGTHGFCYLDASIPDVNGAPLAHCPESRQRGLHFVGRGPREQGFHTFLGCPAP